MPITVHVQNKFKTVNDEKTVIRNVYAALPASDEYPTGKYILLAHQKALLKRSGQKDLSTGRTKWEPWSTATFSQVAPSTYWGYELTSSPNLAPEVTVDGTDSELTDVVFQYVAEEHAINVDYTDHDMEDRVNNRVPVSETTGSRVSFDYLSHLVQGYAPGNPILKNIYFDQPLNDTVKTYVHFNYNNKFHASIEDGERIITYVGAKMGSPTLDPAKVRLVFSDTIYGICYNPQDKVHVIWEKLPNTTNPTTDASPTFGILKIVGNDGTFQLLTVPVVVEQNRPSTEPAKSTYTEYHTVYRTIQLKFPDENEVWTWKNQTATITRSVEEDLTTGEKKYGQWSSATWPAETAPEVEGYKIDNPDHVNEVTIKDDNAQSSTVTFNYSYAKLKQVINYVDVDQVDANNNFKIIKSKTLTGDSFKTTDLNLKLPDDYELVSKSKTPKKISFIMHEEPAIDIYIQHKNDKTTKKNVKVHLAKDIQVEDAPNQDESLTSLPFNIKKQRKNIFVGDDVKPSDFISNIPDGAQAKIVWDDNADTSKKGTITGHITITIPTKTSYRTTVTIKPAQDKIIAWNDGTVHKYVTRTIHYQGAGDQTPADKIETGGLSRTAIFDGQGGFTWTNWTPNGSFKRVKTPQIAGYTADKDVVESYTPTATDSDFTVTVTYTPNTTPDIPGKTPDIPKKPDNHPKDDKPKKPEVKKSTKSVAKKQNSYKVIKKQVSNSLRTRKAADSPRHVQASLPQTGSSHELSLAAIAGILSIGLSLTVALFTSKKKHN